MPPCPSTAQDDRVSWSVNEEIGWVGGAFSAKKIFAAEVRRGAMHPFLEKVPFHGHMPAWLTVHCKHFSPIPLPSQSHSLNTIL